MEQKFISPMVATNEYDLSYLGQGISDIGAAFVGPTTKGPAFIPTNVASANEYYKIFGYADGYSYMPYSIKEYLKNSSVASIIRILGLDGYTHNSVAHLIMSGSFGQKVVGVFHRSTLITGQDEDDTLASSSVTYVSSGSFNLHLEAPATAESTDYSASFDSTAANFISKVVKSTANTTDAGYAYQLYKNNISTYYTADPSASVSMQFTNLDMTQEYQSATTPWITSQTVGASVANLFRFKTISNGNYVNQEIKVTIENVKLGSEVPGTDYGSFTVLVRAIDDNDRQMSILEQFVNVNLDPTSTKYIGREIGTKINTYSDGDIISAGEYDNKSQYIVVEISSEVENGTISPSMVPWGFRAIKQSLLMPSSLTLPSASFVTTQEYSGEYNSKIYYGFNFDFDTTDNKQYLMPLEENSLAGANLDFSLDNYTIHADSTVDPGESIISADVLTARKFIVPFQGGFDGQDPALVKNMGSAITTANSMGFNFTNSTSGGSVAYNRAVELLRNTDMYDFNLVVTPGLIYDLHSYPTSQFIDLCETRGDAFYILDTVQMATAYTAAGTVTNTLDTSYAGTYYPWIKILDTDNNRYMWVPPSVMMAGAYSYNDRISAEWYAPAGLNRGNLGTVTETYFKLSQSKRDDLYENRINAIATFPKEGITCWGQKTLQVKSSALDRINVRRLMIKIKKYIASVGKYVIFEPNTRRTRNQLYNQINPYLEQIQQKQGIYTFKLVLDETVNTSDLIDRNIMKGKLWIQPARTVEFISIDLNITPTGASFSE